MKYTIKNNITKVQRSIAYVLLLSELLTSCGFKETILPRIQPQAPITSTCAIPLDTSLAASDSTFQLVDFTRSPFENCLQHKKRENRCQRSRSSFHSMMDGRSKKASCVPSWNHEGCMLSSSSIPLQ